MNETDIHTFLNSLTKEQFVLFLEREVKQNSDLLQNLYNFLTSSLQVESVPKELDFTSSVSKHSSAQEKISLFRSFFCSRTDVFALRWANEKTGASGYSPVCANKWVQGKCNIKKIPCAKCAFRSSLELSDEYIFKHLVGKDSLCRDVIGMYALRSDDTCRFLALDFDEETWKSEVKALRKLCSENLIPVAVEISRSGNGAQMYLHFVGQMKKQEQADILLFVQINGFRGNVILRKFHVLNVPSVLLLSFQMNIFSNIL